MAVVHLFIVLLPLLLSACSAQNAYPPEEVERIVRRFCADSLEYQARRETEDSLFFEILDHIDSGRVRMTDEERERLLPYRRVDVHQMFLPAWSSETPLLVLRQITFPDTSSAQAWVELLYSDRLLAMCHASSACFPNMIGWLSIETVRSGRSLFMLVRGNRYYRSASIEDFVTASDGVIHSHRR